MLDQAAKDAAGFLYTALVSAGALAAFIGGARTHAYKVELRMTCLGLCPVHLCFNMFPLSQWCR